MKNSLKAKEILTVMPYFWTRPPVWRGCSSSGAETEQRGNIMCARRARGTSADSFVTWNTISESVWAPLLRGRFLGPRVRIRRVRPGDEDYAKVVSLRYRGFVESGFVDPRTTGESAMRLARDCESIILGMFRRTRLLATVTLNTITPQFPGMAMELDKKVEISHPYFRDPAVIEITKLVVDRRTRGRRIALAMLFVTSLIARVLGKPHLWQVSRDIPSDMSWRAGLGFDYSVRCRFHDPDLNQMPSQVGYLYLPSAIQNPHVPRFIRAIYQEALAVRVQEESA